MVFITAIASKLGHSPIREISIQTMSLRGRCTTNIIIDWPFSKVII